MSLSSSGRNTARHFLGFLCRFCQGVFLLFLTNSLVVISFHWAEASNIKLNQPLPDASGTSNVRRIRISPDSSRVVYSDTRGTTRTLQLHSALLSATPNPILLNPTQPMTQVNFFDVTPNGSHVVYQADENNLGEFELFSVPISSNSPTRLQTGDVELFKVTNNWVVYTVERNDFFSDLFKVPLDGSSGPVGPLNTEPLNTGQEDFLVSPDGNWVVYRDRVIEVDPNAVGLDITSLFSIPLDGSSGPILLNGPLILDGDVKNFRISPDSSRVVYRADEVTNNDFELFSVPIDGSSARVKLNGTLVALGDVLASQFQISSDSSSVVYLADQVTDNVNELFSVPLSGGAVTQLGTGAVLQNNFQISPNGQRVVYRVSGAAFEIFSAPLDGSGPVKLNPDLDPGENVDDFKISPDSSRVVYLADQDTAGIRELFSVPLGGGAFTKLNGPIVNGGNMSSEGEFDFSPDSSQVVYRADQDTAGVRELYSVPILGGAVVKLNDPAQNVTFDPPFEITPNSTQAVYARSFVNGGGSVIREIFLTTTPDFAGGNAAQLVAGSPVTISQNVDVPSVDPTDLLFEYEFKTTTGSLTVELNNVVLGVINAPGTLVGAFTSATLAIPANLLGANGVPLSFTFDSSSQEEMLLNNVRFSGEFRAVFNGDFATGELTGWTVNGPGTANVIDLTVPPDEPVASLDSFQCFDARKVYSPRKYRYKRYGGVTYFKSHSRRRVEPESFCSPVSVNGEETSSPSAHLTCYEKKHWKFSRHFWRWWKFHKFKRYRYRPKHQELTVDNLVGEQQTLKVEMRPEALCLPTGKGEESTIPTDLDRFKCADARGGRPENSEVTIEDMTYKVIRATAFCTPVDGENKEIEEAADHLACYKVRVKRSRYSRYDKWKYRKHRYRSEKIVVNNDFGEGQKLRIDDPDTLCLRTTVSSSEVVEAKKIKKDDDDDGHYRWKKRWRRYDD